MCKNIEISISNTANNLLLILKDDGKGFDTQKIEMKGLGLKNMQKRVEMIKGSFNLESDIESGTKLIIKIPV